MCAALLCCAVLQQKIVERAKQMTEDDSADRLNQKAALQQEFEQLLNIFFTGERVPLTTARLPRRHIQCAAQLRRQHCSCMLAPCQQSPSGCASCHSCAVVRCGARQGCNFALLVWCGLLCCSIQPHCM